MCPESDSALDRIDSKLSDNLRKHGVAKAAIFAVLTRHEPGTAEARRDLGHFLTLLATDPEKLEGWTDDLLHLHGLAKGVAPEVAQRYGRLSGYEVSADILTLKHREQRAAEGLH